MHEQQSRPDIWEAHSAEVERLIKAVEQDGDAYSLALGELLRSLNSISQTLSGKRASVDPTADRASINRHFAELEHTAPLGAVAERPGTPGARRTS